MLTKEIFDTKFPEFTDVTAGEFSNTLGLYPNYVGFEYGNDKKQDNIILYLMAHLYVTVTSAASTGEELLTPTISSQSVGGVSLGYAVNSMSSRERSLMGDFESTKYGKMYLSLLANSFRYSPRAV